MLSNDEIYIGTKLKYLLEIGCSGFNMDEDRFTVDIMRGPNTIHLEKEDLEMDENGCWYVCFDTMELGTGVVTAKVTAYVTDTDYPDEIRTEVQKIKLVNIVA